MTDSAIHSNKFSTAEVAIATVRIQLHQEVIRQAHPAVAAVPVHQEAVVVEAAVAVAQLVRAEVAIKSLT